MARMLFVSFARYHRHTFPAVMHIFVSVFILIPLYLPLRATSILRVYTTQEEKKHIDA
ncbi:hypothetical protein [Morganella morganii]|uniref:hypothetical protein n=1 Tax=Morganella morganii TaxID=582 RepID=UPI0019682464|nr:hypothetical protein [Morganella morganii]